MATSNITPAERRMWNQAYSQHDPQMALTGVLQRQRQRVDLISVQWRGQEEEDHREAETAKV